MKLQSFITKMMQGSPWGKRVVVQFKANMAKNVFFFIFEAIFVLFLSKMTNFGIKKWIFIFSKPKIVISERKK